MLGTVYYRRIIQIRDEHLLFKKRWATPWVPECRYDVHISSSTEIARQAHNRSLAYGSVVYFPPVTISTTIREDGDPSRCIIHPQDDDEGEDEQCESEPDTGPFEDNKLDVFDASSDIDINEDILEALDLGDRPIDDEDLENIATLTCRWEIQVGSV